ncbi:MULTISPECIES: ABC transporter substrate-binding protein [unclassified Marinitoga]|uniref:ABC transporter substrate-binding protein n=1 Tax=unclassified Marinitoga TaxID=2640159 RepID=UPI000640F8CC|nr:MULTISPECIES: ABC transporter substrate-binding protein [unclassified Marinitoga]KLO23472.1 peptide ABC transporter substrate-binding protein [Marinitoga sp. 1155]NUV00010.1 peptide ABC transporter substrate-binding protein [Marinitoga sp. 1154]
MKRLLVALLLVFSIFTFAAVMNPNTIVDVTIGEPDTLDPHQAYDTASGEVIYNVYDNLIQYKGSSLSEFEPRIAESWEIDGNTVKFKIRKGVKFHSGNELTPYDVEYTFERALIGNPGGGPIWMLYEVFFGDYFSLKSAVKGLTGKSWSELVNPETKEPVNDEAKQILLDFYEKYINSKVEVDGDYVVFHLAAPKVYFLNIIAQGSSWGAILDSKAAMGLGLWDGKADGWWKFHDWKKEDSPLYAKEIGSGPYELVEWNRAEQKVTLKAFPEYWRGPAKVENVVIWGVDEWSTRKALLEKGEADIVAVPAQYLSQIKGNPDIEIIEGLPSVSVTTLNFNWQVKPDSPYIGSGKLDGNGIPVDFFADKNVRLGFIYSFDYKKMIDEVLDGYGELVPTAMPKGFLGYDDNLPKPKFDLKEATKYFKRAFRGQLWRKGFKMTILYNTGNAARQKSAELLADSLKKINAKFQAEVRGVQWPTFLDARKNGKMPLYILGWLADYPDPNNFIYTFYHSNGDYGYYFGEKYAQFANKPQAFFGGKSLNEMIEEAASLTDPEARKEIYIKVQEFVIREGLGVPLYQPIGVRVHRKWLKGWYPNSIRPGDDYYAYWKSDE